MKEKVNYKILLEKVPAAEINFSAFERAYEEDVIALAKQILLSKLEWHLVNEEGTKIC